MLNRETWYEEASSSDLLLNELSRRKSGSLVKKLFREYRFNLFACNNDRFAYNERDEVTLKS